MVVESLSFGPRGLDELIIVGFYTNDGNVTVTVNHIDGLLTLDDADLMFPTKEESS